MREDWPQVAPEIVRELRSKRPLLAAALFLFNAITYAALACIGLSVGSLFLWIPIWWTQSLILAGVFGMVHESAHNTLVERGGRALGSALGAVVMVNFSLYRSYHLGHHARTMIEGDPEGSHKLGSISEYLVRLPALAFFGEIWKASFLLLRNRTLPYGAGDNRLVQRVAIDSCVVACWLITVALLAAKWPRIITTVYLMPLVMFFPTMGWTSLPEHYGTEVSRSVLVNTRTITSNTLFRLFFWYNNFHAEHHSFPGIPAYNLPRLHQLIGNQFRHRERSYFRFHWRVLTALSRKRVQ